MARLKSFFAGGKFLDHVFADLLRLRGKRRLQINLLILQILDLFCVVLALVCEHAHSFLKAIDFALERGIEDRARSDAARGLQSSLVTNDCCGGR